MKLHCGAFLPFTFTFRRSPPKDVGVLSGILGLPCVSCHWRYSLVGERVWAQASPLVSACQFFITAPSLPSFKVLLLQGLWVECI